MQSRVKVAVRSRLTDEAPMVRKSTLDLLQSHISDNRKLATNYLQKIVQLTKALLEIKLFLT